ncbi:tautomerase family protein [Roseomonas chloroacetimidivorans]|jgi:4-oxalocrotonate tautomerase|uniref:tautomerase family protein n=1 Tax=Roseomonas chloroacetimidivorans TaxID=1766656 RepID=UPI003C72B51B
MPFINIRCAGTALTGAQTARLQEEARRILVESMRKRADWIVVLVEETSWRGWSIVGQQGGIAAHVRTTINAGGSTAEEKARYVGATYAMLCEVLGGGLGEMAYVEILELEGGAWGFGGLTNADRAAMQRVSH